MKKRKIFSIPLDKKNPHYIVIDLRNMKDLYVVSQNDFLSANIKSDKPIDCIKLETIEFEDAVSYSLSDPLQTIEIERGYLAGIFLTNKVQ